MSAKKYIIPAALAIGAISMMGVQAFAQGTTPPTQTTPEVQAVSQTADDNNKGADIETNDDKGTAAVSDTDKEVNDDGDQAEQNDSQDSGQSDGETNDGN